jgi:hypothetical protein
MKKNHDDIPALFDEGSSRESNTELDQFKALKKAASTLKVYPTPANFAARVLSLYSLRRQESFWNNLPLLPRPLTRAALALSLIIISLVLFSGDAINGDHEPYLTEDSDIMQLDDVWLEPSIQTYDQALQFALLE